MGRYLKHCGRAIVSLMWVHCPYCGDKLGATVASTVEQSRPSQGPSKMAQLVSELDVAKVSQLRKAIRVSGSDRKSRSRSGLVGIIEDMMVDDASKVSGLLATLVATSDRNVSTTQILVDF